MDADVCVIGAGPAGTAAAIVLADAGLDVLVLDTATFPRDKCCGDGLTALALGELHGLGFEPEWVPSWSWTDGIVLRAPNGLTRRFGLPSGPPFFAAAARRNELDAALAHLAGARGARLHMSDGVRSVQELTDCVEVTSESAVVRARWAIAADGARSAVRRSLFPGFSLAAAENWQAFRDYLPPQGGSATSSVWFDHPLMPGYGWAFPLADGTVNVGFGVLREAADEGGRRRQPVAAKAHWERLLEQDHVRRTVDITRATTTPKGWLIPCQYDGGRLTASRTLFVGDAACLPDPMTGEGIGQALRSGRVAAETIIAGGTPASITARYRAEIDRDIGASIRVSRLVRRALRHRKGVRIPTRLFGSSELLQRSFALWLYEAVPRRALFTPRGWLGLVRRPPGAY